MKRAILAICALAISLAIPATAGASVLRHGNAAPAAMTAPIVIWPGNTLSPPLVVSPGVYYPPILPGVAGPPPPPPPPP